MEDQLILPRLSARSSRSAFPSSSSPSFLLPFLTGREADLPFSFLSSFPHLPSSSLLTPTSSPNHFSTLRAPHILVEALTGDFNGEVKDVTSVALSGLDVYAHNVETVERLSPTVRDRRAKYRQSLEVLRLAKEVTKGRVVTKTSLMLGVGEQDEELLQTLKGECFFRRMSWVEARETRRGQKEDGGRTLFGLVEKRREGEERDRRVVLSPLELSKSKLTRSLLLTLASLRSPSQRCRRRHLRTVHATLEEAHEGRAIRRARRVRKVEGGRGGNGIPLRCQWTFGQE